MLHLPLLIDLLLAFTGIAGGLVDSIAGGGGIVTLPVLLAVGLSPISALGTNRMQGAIGELVATRQFIKSGQLQYHILLSVALFTMIGASVGTITVQLIHIVMLKKLIPLLLLLVVVYSLFSGRLLVQRNKPRCSVQVFALLCGLGLGFYNGFFGPGVGSLWITAFLCFLAMDLRLASMHAKPVNLVGNLVSLAWFASQGHVVYTAALALGAGQIIGASVGARLVIHRGAKFIKPVFIAVVVVIILQQLYRGFL